MTPITQSEADLKQLLEALDTGYWEYDHLRDRMYYSPRLRAWLGNDFPAGEYATLAEWVARIHADDRPAADAAIQAFCASDTPYHLEYRFIRSDGNSIWLDVRGVAVERDADGRPVRTLGTKVDTTERRQQQELLRLQQQFNQVLLDNPEHDSLVAALLDTVLALSELDGGGLYELRPGGKFSLIASRGISTEFIAQASEIEPGSSRDRLLQAGRVVCSCVQPTAVCTDHDLIRQPHLQAEGIMALLVYPIEVSGCVYASLNLASKHVQSLPAQIVTFLESIARQFGQALERLQARQEAAKQRRNLEAFFQAITDFVFVLDDQGGIRYVNPAVKLRLGYDEALIGKSVLAVHPARVHQEAMQVVADMLAGRYESCPLPLLRADGSEIQVDTRVVHGVWDGEPALLGISRDISQLKAVQDELLKRDRYQRALLDNFPFMVWLKDRDSCFLAVNQVFATVAGQPNPESLVGKSDLDIWPQELAQHYQADDRAVLESGQARTVEEEVEENGQRFWMETYKSPVTMDGRIIGTVGFARDISDRIEAQRALEHERGFLKTLIQTIPDLVWLKDPAGVYLACNPRFEQLYAAKEADIVGKTDYDFVSEELADFFRANDLAAIAAGRSRINEEWLDFADGSPGALFETSKTPMLAADGNVIGVLGIAHDITAARAAENALRESGERRRQLMEVSRDGIAIINQEHRIIEANQRFAEMLGYDAEEVLQLHTWDWEANLSEADVRSQFADLSRISTTFETVHRRRDGSCYEVEVSATGASVDGASVVITVSRDISQRKAAERALRDSETSLNLAQQVANIGSWQLDIPTSRLHWSDQAYRIFDLPLGAPLSLDVFFSCIHSDDRAAVGEAWQAALSGAPYDIEHRILTREGVRWVREKAQISFVDGRPVIGIGTVQDISERRKARIELERSEERYRILADYSTDWQYWLGPDGSYLYVSPGCENITGYPPQAFLQDAGLMRTIMHLDDWNLWDAHLKLIDSEFGHTSRAHAQMEFRIISRDGSVHWIEHQCQPVTSETAEYRGRRGVNRDITQRKLAELSLRAERDRSQRYLDTIEAVIVALDRDGNVTLINRKGCELLGYQPRELLGENWFSRCLPQPQGMRQVLPAFHQIISGQIEQVEYYENSVLTRSGAERLIAWHNSVIRDAEGRISGTLSAGEDVTEQRAAARALAESTLFLRESQRIARVGGWKANPDSGMLVWTDEVYRLCEHPLDQPPNLEQGLSYYAPEYRPRIIAALQATWRGGQPFTMETEMLLRSGRRFWAELRCIGRVEDADGAYIAGTFQDVSERKSIQSELEQHREHLEALVVQRTRELIFERERAEAASRTKSTFLANMSHEIRTPMNAIIGLTHLMQNATADAKQQEQLSKISAAAQHLMSIINDILDISKIEAGKMRMEMVDFQLEQVIDKVLDLIRDGAQTKGIKLSREIDPSLPPVLRGDALRLGQILLNFAGNAVKFTEHGAISVTAGSVATKAGETGLRVRFEVSDTGIGMSDEQVARLFQAFEQADASTSRKYGGTGLGLAISKRLVGLMGGDMANDIGVVSQPGEGSRFWCEIPFTRGTGEPEAENPFGNDLRLALAAHAGARILLAEDNPINQEVALQLLAEVGLAADVAANGNEALALLARNEYDLVLMDVQMPVLDGLAATREIRAQPQHADLPILAMTANVYEEDRERCLLAGMNDHIAKPVDPKALYTVLLKWLPRKAAPTAAVRVESETPAASPALDPDHFRLDGLDVTAGLKRVGGRTASYLRLLDMYCNTHLDDLALLREKLATGDQTEAQRIAHTLKGTSGTLGMVGVQADAAAVEALIRKQSGRAAIEAALAQLETTQARMIGELRARLSATTAKPAEAVVDPVLLDATLAELESLLRDDDLAAAALLRKQQPVLALRFTESELALLRQQVDRFDFAAALETLSAAQASRPHPS